MRVAVMIIALCLTMLIGLQSCAATLGGSLIQDEATTGAGAVGILLAFIFVLGAAFAIGFPRVSGVLFLIGGVVAILAGAGSRFGDLGIWGGASIILSIMAFIGARELGRTPASSLDLTDQAGLEPADERRSPLMPTLTALAVAGGAVGVLLATGVLRLGDLPGQSSTADTNTARAAEDADQSEGAAMQSDSKTAASQASALVGGEEETPFTDAAGRRDVPTTDTAMITEAWLVGEWATVPSDGDRSNACDTDGTVNFASNGTYSDGAGNGRFATDGRTITYHHRVLVDEVEDTEDRSEYNRPLTLSAEAVDANTLREDGATLVRCAAQ